MKNSQKWIQMMLVVAGIAEIAIGLSHFGMPAFAYKVKGFSGLIQNEINFITLSLFSVGILLIAFGVCTIFISSKRTLDIQILLYYAIVKSSLWLARIVLEVFYPVKIPLFFIEQPTFFIMPFLVLEWLLFVSSVVLIVKHMEKLPNKAN
jgi:hypothetical protein